MALRVRLLLLLLLLTPVMLALHGCSWFGGDKPLNPPAPLQAFKTKVSLRPMWNASLGRAGAGQFSPATDGQAVYAADGGGNVVKLDLATGRTLWRVALERPLTAGVGVGDGLALVGTGKGEVIALRTHNGSVAWRAQVGGEILVAPDAGHGRVAVRANNGAITLLQSIDGAQVWVNARTLPSLTLRQQSQMVLTADALFAGHAGGRLSALALNNGAPLWEANVTLPRGATELERIADVTGPLALDERRICAASFQGRVACFDPLRGGLLWGREVSALSGVGMDERMLYVVDEHSAVLAYDKQRGTHPWKQEALKHRRLSAPLALGGRYVAAADFEGYIHLLNVEDGALAGRVASDGSGITGNLLPLDGGLIAQTVNGGLYAYKLQ